MKLRTRSAELLKSAIVAPKGEVKPCCMGFSKDRNEDREIVDFSIKLWKVIIYVIVIATLSD